MSVNPYQTVIDAINAILNDTSLDDYTESVIDRLVSFGYTPLSGDAFAIAFAMQKTYSHILNQTNQVSVPDKLKQVFIDMICGEFLNMKHATGQLTLSGLDFSAIVQSVHEGDTTVNFASEGSDEAKFASLIAWLLSGEGCDLLCYRRIVW